MLAIGRTLAGLAFDWTDSNLTYGVCLAIVLLLGAATVALVKRWQKQGTSATMSPSEQLAEYTAVYDQGVMSKEEFERLRALLIGQVGEPPSPAAPPGDPQTNVLLKREPPPAPAAQPQPPRADGIVQSPPSPEAGNGQT
jgi:hypothetical protein